MDSTPCNRQTDPAVLAQLRALAERAQAGDAAALPHLRRVLDTHPEVWRHVGDLSALVERAWASALSAADPLAFESMLRTAAAMKRDLAGEHPGCLEQMLVDQVVTCWMETRYAEMATSDQGEASLKQAGFRLRRLESAQKRHLAAVKELATLRRLQSDGRAPAVEVGLYEAPDHERAHA
jgi:hypothetical protein